MSTPGYYFCKRCGKAIILTNSAKFPVCNFCGYEDMVYVSVREHNEAIKLERTANPSLDEWDAIPGANYRIREKYIFNIPTLDKTLYNKMVDAELAEVKKDKEEVESWTSNKPRKPDIKCPTCDSLNTYKISGMSKSVSVGLFGLFSQRVKRQFHCNNCGYEW